MMLRGKQEGRRMPCFLKEEYGHNSSPDISLLLRGSPFEVVPEPAFLCAACGYPITSHEAMIKMNGSFRHRFMNPAGIEYEIGCFSKAGGCTEYGVPTCEFTWFPGFSWNLALCDRCAVHLGWLYRSTELQFFGLILERLVENTLTH